MTRSLERHDGISVERERRWGFIGGATGSMFGVGAAVVSIGVDGASFLETGPYPEIFESSRLLAMDVYLLATLVAGSGFLAAAGVYARRSPHPRSDAFGATLTGGILTTLAGLILFVRLYALVGA